MLLDSVPRYGYDCYLLLLTLKRQLWRYHHGSLWLLQVPVGGQLRIVLLALLVLLVVLLLLSLLLSLLLWLLFVVLLLRLLLVGLSSIPRLQRFERIE
jgi:hypothetical protein